MTNDTRQTPEFRGVARKKQSLSQEEIRAILHTQKRGVLSVHGENGYPYGLPINFLYEEESGNLYFHSGKSGHKTDAVRANNKVCFCVYDEGFRNEGEWALNIRSVIVFGDLFPVDDPQRIAEICRKLSLKFTSDLAYIESEIERFAAATVCYELRPKHVTGKLVNEA